jgi:GT2 family glycosyltransferase
METTFQEELYYQYIYEKNGSRDTKDIVIIVHDQPDFTKRCVDSIYQHTRSFNLYLWDNNSMIPTKEYLEEVAKRENVTLIRSPENIGFIKPNNELVKLGKSPYIILLNSDTEVMQGWDTALIGWLKGNPKCAITGYQGGILGPDGKGFGGNTQEFDYICGWCLCLSRDTYDTYGLFDEENLCFAYGEDSDLSLRVKEAGFDIHSLQMKLVKHFGNVTSIEVHKELDTSESFRRNHDYIRKRWYNYLVNKDQ